MLLRNLVVTGFAVRLLAATAMLTGSMWLALWFSAIAPRWSAEGGNTVKTNMALCQVLAGLALVLLAPREPKALPRWLAMMLASLVFLAGALTLSEHVFSYNLGIDQVLASEPPGASATASPNRMGPPGSCSLILVGAGLLFLALQRARLAAWLGLSVCVITLIPAVGFVYGISGFYSQPRLTGISWPTVLVLLSLGAGLILARPTQGPAAQLLRDDAGGILLRRLLPAVILIPLVLGFLRVQGQERGWYDTATGTGAVMIMIVLGFLFVLWRTATTLNQTADAKVQVEAELRDREERFATLVEQAPVGIFETDAQGACNFVNDHWQALAGLSAAEAAGEGWREGIHPDDRERVSAEWYAAAEAQRVFTSEYRFRTPGGKVSWVMGSAKPIRDASGAVVRYLGTLLDITERKESEDALRERDERFRTLLANLESGVALVDEHGRFVLYNRSFLRIFGLSSDIGNLNDQDWSRWLVFSEDGRLLELDEHPVRKAALTGKPVRNQLVRVKRPSDGVEVWLLVSAEPILNPRGKLAVLICAYYDITERMQAEEEVRAKGRDLAEAQRLAGLGSWEWDIRVNRVKWSRELYQLLLLDDRLPAPTYAEQVPFYTPESRRRLDEAVTKALRDGSSYVLDIEMIRTDAKRIWVTARGEVVRDGSGELAGLRGTVLDITERKRVEKELAKYRDELEQLVAERTAKLQELVGELEHFSYTITHDLKAPLRAMRGFAEMAGDVCRESEARPFLEKISAAAERMDLLIRDALDYSQAVRRELPLENVDTGPLLRGILDSYPQFQSSRAHIRVQGPLPVVVGNEAGLTQCFSNLLGNAVKFVKRGQTPEVRVWAEVLADGEWVRFWVEDNGIGISRQMLPRLFDMFSRANKEYEGTGIGLALVRKVVQRMGGRLGVESEEGKGSRFWMQLKLGKAAQPSREQARNETPKHDGRTVLYVEDEENDATLMEMAFAAKGMKSALRVVGDGRAAIDYLSGNSKYADRDQYPVPSVVLLDLNLPSLSGFAVLEWIRNHPDLAQTPVVVFSSSTLDADRAKARQLGANEFLSKPSSGLEFGRVVDELKAKWMS